MTTSRAIFLVTFVGIFFAGCARTPLKKKEDALRPASAPTLADDLDLVPLAEGVRRQAAVLRNQPAGFLTFGKRVISKEEYAGGLEAFARLVDSIPDREAFLKAVNERFEFHEVYGGDRWGDVLVTSYYEPEVRGSRKRTERFTQPLLKAPGDLIEVPLARWDDRFTDLNVGPMRGRLSASGNTPGRLQLLPYFTREEIDGGAALGKRGLELAWVDPIDAFFMQVQGSGTVILDDGSSLRLGYSDQNGHKYESIGKFLIEKLPPKTRISMQVIEMYLRTIPDADRRAILNRNPSYIFFRERDGKPLTSFGTPAVAGRTIATDARYFPKGSLGFLSFEKPFFDAPLSSENAGVAPTRFDKASRFVMDDDVGGAIKGGGRVDLFWGSGNEAQRFAGWVKQPGRLYYLVPKAGVAVARVAPLKGSRVSSSRFPSLKMLKRRVR